MAEESRQETIKFYLPCEQKISEYSKTIEHLKKENKLNPIFSFEIRKLEDKLDSLKSKVYRKLTPWDRVQICRHSQRPKSLDYIHNVCEKFIELSGDRTYADDKSLIGGFALIGGQPFILIGQEKGHDTDSRMKHNFGMMSPEGFRKALRLMKLAEKFNLPVVSLVDTPGAYAGLEAEERGQGWAIAKNLLEMARLQTPIIVVIIGEGSSGGALGIAVGDVIGMLQHAYYSVISPEGCASILWKDAQKKEEAAKTLRLNAEDLIELGIIDEIIQEPLGGAHHNPYVVYKKVKQFILTHLARLQKKPLETLLEERYAKYRDVGFWTE